MAGLLLHGLLPSWGQGGRPCCRDSSSGGIVMPSPAGRALAGTRSKAEDEKVGTCDLPFSPPNFFLIFFANHLNSQSYPGWEKTANH